MGMGVLVKGEEGFGLGGFVMGCDLILGLRFSVMVSWERID